MSNEQDNPITHNGDKKSKFILRLKALGLLGFLFFLAKGIGWLFFFYLAGKGCS